MLFEAAVREHRWQNSGRRQKRSARTTEFVIASEAKQSRVACDGREAVLDCFVAELVIGPATSGRTRWLLAMTNRRGGPCGRPIWPLWLRWVGWARGPPLRAKDASSTSGVMNLEQRDDESVAAITMEFVIASGAKQSRAGCGDREARWIASSRSLSSGRPLRAGPVGSSQ
jgi:hypothetical protein